MNDQNEKYPVEEEWIVSPYYPDYDDDPDDIDDDDYLPDIDW